MGWMFDNVGRLTAGYLQKPAERYEPFTPIMTDATSGCWDWMR